MKHLAWKIYVKLYLTYHQLIRLKKKEKKKKETLNTFKVCF